MENVGIVIVTYNPNTIILSQNIREYNEIARHIILIDNSENGLSEKDDLLKISSNIEIIELFENRGIAAAQNIGIKILCDRNIEFIVFFDQDSSLTSKQVQLLMNSFDNERIGLVGPTKKNGVGISQVSETLSSGSIIPVRVINEVGNMREDLFIDLVDYEWCWRAKDAGYLLEKNNEVKIKHQSGEGKFLGFIGISKPFRLYYQFRNFIYLSNSTYIPKKYKRIGYLKLIIRGIVNILFFDSRIERFRYIKRGIKDGRAGRLGKLIK